ncbi:tetratricopeptide repeat-containing protein [Cardiosporidium cionae]|uniref:Tetratricopeptide repeat-containing protein n=1 Tax=Cardiosporidium cionae TaxID=476202 RepID=A0ABQ7J7T9_9APIC|nr:tetratricopeptide repeat-containing protein [Cardiosporidium cionae]|eukprot:KAF8820036.1 tetratricopeptide repeat-containing protein [Cardiosporidium cionae]
MSVLPSNSTPASSHGPAKSLLPSTGSAAPSLPFLGDDDDWDFSPEYAQFLADKFPPEDLPLFADSTPADISDKPAFQALQSILYDDETPESLAAHFKVTGNAFLKEGKKWYADAYICYSKGIEQNCKDAELHSQLYANRAQVSFLKGDWVKCVDDCKRSFESNPNNVKACYRAASASIKLELYQNALQFVEQGLKMDSTPENSRNALLHMKELCHTRLQSIKEAKSRAIRDKALQMSASNETICNTLLKRGINVILPVSELFPGSDAAISVNTAGTFIWPVLLLLEEVGIKETIVAFAENLSFSDYLKELYPGTPPFPDWDEGGNHVWHKLNVYYQPFESEDQPIYKVPQDMLLSNVLNSVKTASKTLCFHITIKSSSLEEKFLSQYNVIKL